jgi:hypothetical protein
MCLITEQLTSTTAREDIICYKVLRIQDNNLYAYYRSFEYKIGKLYRGPLVWGKMYSTSEGLYMNINEGFHSYSDIEYAKQNYRDVLESAVIVKCIIPKGTIFFEGEQNFGRGYASNQIIIKEIMKLEDVFPFFDSQAYPYKKGQTIEIINYNVVSTYSVENIVPIQEDYIMLRTNRGILYTSSQGDIF